MTMTDLKPLAAAKRKMARAAAALEKAQHERDLLIVAYRQDGWPWGRIMDELGLTRQAAEAAARRVNAGVTPVPRQRG